MPLFLSIALRHLLARPRQSMVSLAGIILGVAFFLAIAALMIGSEKDFINRLVNTTPHITISDTFRNPRPQPVNQIHPTGAVELRNVKPMTENRGIRGYAQMLDAIQRIPGAKASPVLAGQGILSFAGKNLAVTLNGMVAADIISVTAIEEDMVEGSVADLIANRNGIIIGQEMAKTMALQVNDNVTMTAPTGQVQVFKVVGLFSTGRSSYDSSQAFLDLKRVQALMDQPDRANTIIVKLADPYAAEKVAADLEREFSYKSVSWQEASRDIMNTLVIRNTIMYTVVSAVLVVAAFGIYNVISTVVMEKHRDIAILKSMGFEASDIRRVFLTQGVLLGLTGASLGIPLGMAFMLALGQIRMKPPGGNEIVQMPIAWDIWPFALAVGFAMGAAILAAFLPARKGASVQPVDILRGS